MGSRLGTSTEKIDALNDYLKSPLFSDAEKVALEYADAITDTHSDLEPGVPHPIARVLEAMTDQRPPVRGTAIS
ncbi:MAG: hypothetical protein ACRELS_00970 [Candidatus Rokuibacteriota bacterium]